MGQLYPFNDPVALEAAPPKAMVSGSGSTVVDRDGRPYIDAVAGLWCAALGFDHPRLIAAADAQMRRLPYYHSFLGRTAAKTDELAARLAPLLPPPLSRVFFACSGSEAVDSAVKLMRFFQIARGKPEKRRIIARENAYHGSGVFSAVLTGMRYCHDGFDLPFGHVVRTSRPHYAKDAEPGESQVAFSKRRARELEALIAREGAETIGAFIGEPVMGAGGVIPPPEGYWAEIQAVLKRHDILLIADEIITGFGRTGTWFACEKYEIAPDLMTMAKQLSSAYFPISAVGVSESVAAVIAAQAHEYGVLGHGFTYGGHPVGAAVALETIAVYEEMDLPATVARLGARLRDALAPVAALEAVDNMRVIGLMGGVELVDDSRHGAGFGARVAKEAEDRGVLFRAIGNVLAISPPYVVTEAEIDHFCAVLRDSIVAAA